MRISMLAQTMIPLQSGAAASISRASATCLLLFGIATVTRMNWPRASLSWAVLRHVLAGDPSSFTCVTLVAALASVAVL